MEQKSLQGDMLVIHTALCTLKEVLFDPSTTDTALEEALASSESVVAENGNCTVVFDFKGYSNVVFMKNTYSDPDSFRAIYAHLGDKVTATSSQMERFMPNRYEEAPMWKFVMYELTNSVILFECGTDAMFDFYECAPLAVSMANGNKVYLVEEGTNGKLNDRSTAVLYKNIAGCFQKSLLPAYLKLQLKQMFLTGSYGVIAGEEESILACTNLESHIGDMVVIPAEYLKKCIRLKASYFSMSLEYTVPMLYPLIQQMSINLSEVTAILSPLVMLDWIKELLSSSETPIDFTKIETISGATTKGLNEEQCLSYFYEECMHHYCNLLSVVFKNRKKAVFMQDIAIVAYDGQLYIAVPAKATLTTSYDSEFQALVAGNAVTLRKYHSMPMCPLVQDYYMAGLSCKDSLSGYEYTIKEAIYFYMSRHQGWLQAGISDKTVQLFTGEPNEQLFLSRLLNYNNVLIGKSYNELQEREIPLKAKDAAVSVFGEPHTIMNMDAANTIQISL